MFREDGFRPSDQRGFLHKSFIGRAVGKAVTTFVPGASTAVNLVSTGRRFFGRRSTRATPPRTQTARPTMAGAEAKETGRALKLGGDQFTGSRSEGFIFGGGRAPRLPFVPDAPTSPCRQGESARCCELRNGDFRMQARWQVECGTAGGVRPGSPVGDAVMGQFGAALQPGMMQIERSVCLPGMQLAKDGLCYNKGAITNSQRMWPRGRRPLLTGGDMRAIGIAARAGAKLDRTTKRLRGLGMMKALPKGRGTRVHPALKVPVHKSVDV